VAAVGQLPAQDVQGTQLQGLLDPHPALHEELDQRPIPEGTQLGADRLVTGGLAGQALLGRPRRFKPDTPVQCFGPRTSSFNHHVVERRWVRLGVERRDVYGRLLAYVHLRRRFVQRESGSARPRSLADDPA
jgi:nuclease-like protein